MQVQTYLYFNGCCEEALAFYRQHLEAEVLMSMRFSESPVPMEGSGEGCTGNTMPPGYENKIMHCCFRIGKTEILASDGMCTGTPDFQGFSLALTVADKEEAQHKFGLLADGGDIQMPMEETFFSPAFGMVKDRFGVSWSVLVEQPQG
ncbi:VOC family protein [Kineobactrum salinum]|uniref:VOC family protein n=1 Tax=Kineobactrum salinum TaxID=2708301 RepID=A0A6C0TZS8_9GAMM|nr:VOC family protein [Kineobactrum salinum]QIB64207.1 VOC family protein [Kineobactrum salinum]